MKFVSFVAVALLSATAFANTSYVCTNSQRDIRVRANDSVMVLSRPSVSTGHKTIASFRAEDDVLSVTGRADRGNGKKYEGDVDLRRIGSNRGGELILGTRLDQVDTVALTVKELDNGDLDAVVTLVKRNGEKTWAVVDCQ